MFIFIEMKVYVKFIVIETSCFVQEFELKRNKIDNMSAIQLTLCNVCFILCS